MKIKLKLDGEQKIVSTKAKTLKELFEELELNREMYVVALNGKVVVEQEPFTEEDDIEIIKVVAGGSR